VSDLAVVGGGYWGVVTAYLAEQRGLSVTLYDRPEPLGASRAASGYFAEGWYKGAWEMRLKRARQLADKAGIVLRNSGARVYPVKSRSKPTYRADWYTFEPSAFLALRPADNDAVVLRVGTGFVDVAGDRHEHKAVVVAGGAWTDRLLKASGIRELGVKQLAGTGVILKHAPLPDPVTLHEVNPYNQVALRVWGPGEIRVCATQERKDSEHELYVQAMLRRVAPYFTEQVELRRMRGLRPLLDDGPCVREVAPRVVVAVGGGRIGGLMAFWAGERALAVLEDA
jgi:glycine/D-amino acid oxidase-like deaminating enzyme